MKTTITVLNKRGENATANVIDALEALYTGNPACFGIVTASKQVTEKDPNKIRRQNVNAPIVFGYASSSTLLRDLPQVVKQEKATTIFDGAVYTPTGKTGIAEIIQPQLDCGKMVGTFLETVEGDFALTVLDGNQFFATRDPIGVYPLYYGETEKLAALASNKKALLELGIKEAHSFPPGHRAVITGEGFKFEPIKILTVPEPKPMSMEEAARTLQKLLECAVQTRVWGLKEVAVAFSGGLDSSVVAYLAKKYCNNVQLVHVSLENQPETEAAWEAAEMLDLPLQVHLFKEKDVVEIVPKVLEIIEDPEPLKVSVGVPFYWAAEKTAEAKLRVLLAGQGADELFGGYLRYVKEYMRDGDEKVRQTMFSDVAGIYESNLERDEKICGFHDVALRLPFASYEVVKFALSLPTELKIEQTEDSLRKLVLRKVAENLGIPSIIAQKPKKAVQYSTGLSSVLKKLAKNHETTLGNYLSELLQKQNAAKTRK